MDQASSKAYNLIYALSYNHQIIIIERAGDLFSDSAET